MAPCDAKIGEYKEILMIVRFNPPRAADLDIADQAWFDSDATTNDQAIREIDAEAARHGLVRTREYWLQTFSLPDNRVVRRGLLPPRAIQSRRTRGRQAKPEDRREVISATGAGDARRGMNHGGVRCG
jgi:hypothetical protein